MAPISFSEVRCGGLYASKCLTQARIWSRKAERDWTDLLLIARKRRLLEAEPPELYQVLGKRIDKEPELEELESFRGYDQRPYPRALFDALQERVEEFGIVQKVLWYVRADIYEFLLPHLIYPLVISSPCERERS